jgi:LacI family transcriptional regulator, gluconate utilization system Gnt-I transcriptional repressor
LVGRRWRNRRPRVRLSDVAKKAGVSPITVSRALRNPEIVSEELREVILPLIEEMGYVPDLAARALASRHSGIIGVVVPALNQQVFMNVMLGIEERVRSTDLHIQYANTLYDPNEEIHQLRSFLAQKPAGIILAGAESYDDLSSLIEEAPCPIAHIIDLAQKPARMAVGLEHHAAGAVATRFMLERGYRRIGLLSGRMDIRSKRRRDGYVEAMHEAGLLDPALMVSEEIPTSAALGCRLFAALLDRTPDIDSVFCQNDDLALGVLFECRRRGIRVPEDFGICGFNDLDFAEFTEPGLTTVHVPRYDIGYRAADMLIRAVQEENLSDEKLDLGFTVVERGTTRQVV